MPKPRIKNFRTDTQQSFLPGHDAVISNGISPEADRPVIHTDDISPPSQKEIEASLSEISQLYGDKFDINELSTEQLADVVQRARLYISANIDGFDFKPADLEEVKRQFQFEPLPYLAENYSVPLDAATMPAVPAGPTGATASGSMAEVPSNMREEAPSGGESTLAEDVARNDQDQEAAAWLLGEVKQRQEEFAERLQDFVDVYGEDGLAEIQEEIGPDLTGNASYRDLEELRNRYEAALKNLTADLTAQQSTQRVEADGAESTQRVEADGAESTQRVETEPPDDIPTGSETKNAIQELNKSSTLDGPLGYVPFAPFAKAAYSGIRPLGQAVFGTEPRRKMAAQVAGIPATIAAASLGYNYFFGDDDESPDLQAADDDLNRYIDAAMREVPAMPQQATPQQFRPVGPTDLREEFRRFNEKAYQPQLDQMSPY